MDEHESLAEKLSLNNAKQTDPEQKALLADSVGLAILVLLDRLTPQGRGFVLHDTVRQ